MTSTSSPPLISIIMPCLNGEQHIQTAIDSVLAQTFDDFELIVVDNGSTDQTPEILGTLTDPRIRVLALQERGVSRARNRGLKEARGAFIAFLDSDDTWNGQFLEKMHTALAFDSSAVLAYCGWQNLGLSGGRGEPFIPPDYETPDKAAALLEGCRWPIHACLTRRGAIVEAGGFNTELTIAEDYLLWMDVSATGAIVRVPKVLAQYRHHGGGQATHNRALVELDTFRAKQFFLHKNPQIASLLGKALVESLTWGKLVDAGNALHWQGDIESARPIFRKALMAGKGSFSEKLRMLPSLLPLKIHHGILIARK